ncbi:hypothetical protein ABT084_02850 [Streptomyces sp. NPDC002138]|uniref:hypothetical protein n=1 Tax=Streptomyces sp. NPDC002138 TaxID=3154410 RepID=UPI00332D48F5
MDPSGEDRRTYDPSEEEVLAAVESLEWPSPPDAVVAAVDAMRRAQDPAARRARARAEQAGREQDDRAPSASVEKVLGLLRRLEAAGKVKGHSQKVWRSWGVPTAGNARDPQLWWPTDKWRDALTPPARRHRGPFWEEDVRRERARRAEAPSDEENGVTARLERVAEEMRRQYKARDPFENPGAN